MNIIIFKRGLDKLETVFKPLTDDARDIYFDRLRLLSEELFYTAVDYVIDTHKTRDFPKIGEILEASVQAGKESSGTLPDYSGIKCNECRDIGYILTEHKDAQISARPCVECELGRRIKQGWINSFKKKKK